jgi:recombination protein RecA
MGIRVKVKVVKNKVAAPFKVIELDILFGEGIDKMGSLLDAALDLGVVQRKGSWYSYQDTNFAQGRLNAGVYLKENGGVTKKMEAEIREVMLTSKMPASKVDSDDDESILFDDELDSTIALEGSSILE